MKRRTAINCLKKSGVKPSLQRIAILDYLLSHATHPAVDEIYETLVKDIPTLSRTTVYNTLHLFAENGLATQMALDEQRVRFDGNVSPHAHFHCRCCQKIFDLPLPPEMPMAGEALSEGLKVEQVEVNYRGLCAECQKKQEFN